MEHDREPGMVEAGMESDSEWIWKMRNERSKSLLVVEPCSHVTETRVISWQTTGSLMREDMNQGGTT